MNFKVVSKVLFKEGGMWVIMAMFFLGLGALFGMDTRIPVSEIITVECVDNHVRILYHDKIDDTRNWYGTEIECNK